MRGRPGHSISRRAGSAPFMLGLTRKVGVGRAAGRAIAQKSKKPLINRGLSWCPRGDLNPHAR